jgi:ketosteroid isomerase-like protein
MRIPLSFSILLIVLVVSCGNSQNRDIEKVLDMREKAFETKDEDLYMSLISPEYSQEKKGKIIGPEEVRKNFNINVKLFDSVSLSTSDRTIYRDGDKAEVFQKTIVNARDDEGNKKLKLNEKMTLAKENGKWLIVKESDEDFFYGFVFGQN